jgi:hypothetical protein
VSANRFHSPEWEDAVWVANGKVSDLSSVASGNDRVVTCGDDGLGQSAAQSGGASGDEPSGHVMVSFCFMGRVVAVEIFGGLDTPADGQGPPRQWSMRW